MRFALFLFAAALFLFSCRTQNRLIYNYLEDVRDTTLAGAVAITEPVIQKNDQLHIQVYSASTRPEIDQLYNLQTSTGAVGQGTQIQGYLVDQRGNLELPRIGVVRAEGLTKQQLADLIKSKLANQLTDPTVIIRFLNFRVNVLGEVGSPGVKTIPTENLTILEALGLAGDITEFGKKTEVKVLRENNGRRETGVIDLTSRKMFDSKFYHLQQNDVVFVEQTRYKIQQTEQQRISQQLGFALSIITSIALLYNIFR